MYLKYVFYSLYIRDKLTFTLLNWTPSVLVKINDLTIQGRGENKNCTFYSWENNDIFFSDGYEFTSVLNLGKLKPRP